MASYVFSLSRDDFSNWDICKSSSLIGTRSSGAQKRSAPEIEPGDTIYVWKSGGASRGGGLIAKLRAIDYARPSNGMAPWPNPEQYTYLIPVELIHELRSAIGDTFPGHQKGLRFRLQNTDLQKGLRPISEESAELLAAQF